MARCCDAYRVQVQPLHRLFLGKSLPDMCGRETAHTNDLISSGFPAAIVTDERDTFKTSGPASPVVRPFRPEDRESSLSAAVVQCATWTLPDLPAGPCSPETS